MLDADIKAQLAQYLELLEGDVVLKVSAGSDKPHRILLPLLRSSQVCHRELK